MTPVVDATVALRASGVADGFDEFGDDELVAPPLMWSEARSVLHELGWAKTYDAEYVALARPLGCRLVPLDGRLHRGARRLGIVVAPHEL